MMNIVETIFELGINVIETLIIVEFLTHYLDYKIIKNQKLAFFGSWFVIFAELCFRNYIVEFEYLAGCAPIMLYFLYTVLFLKGNIFLKLWLSILIQGIIAIIAMGTNLIVCNILGYDSNSLITVFNGVRIISVIITKVLLFYMTRIILKRKYKNPIEKHSWFLLIFIPVISIFSLYALMIAVMRNEDVKIYVLCGMAGVVIADIATYYFFTVLNKHYDAKLKIEMLEQQNENALKSIESSEAFVKEMRGVKHDIKNHLLMIQNYIEENQSDTAKEYISKLTEDYLPNIQKYVDTGNSAFDALVNSKMAICHQKNIHIDIKPQKNCMTKIDEADIVVLFGNLLDNAIEAAEKTVDKHIIIEFGIKAAYLSIVVSNTVTESVLKTNPNLESTKKDGHIHGVGLKSVRNIVERYDGMIDFFEEDNYFGCHVLLVVE